MLYPRHQTPRSSGVSVGCLVLCFFVPVFFFFFFKQKTAYEIGLGIPAEPLFRSHCIQMDTSVNAANQVVSVGADIAFDADPKFFACLVRFESSSVPTTLPTAYDVYPLDGRHDGGYYTVKDCVTIDVLPRTPGNNVYVGFMVWSNFTATKCRGLVSLNQVIKEIICLQPLK